MHLGNCRGLRARIGGVVLVVSAVCASATGADELRTRRLIYNADADNMFLYAKPPMQPADLQSQVDQIADNGFTTLFMCANVGMTANFSGGIVELSGTYLTPEQNEHVAKVAAEKAATLERGVVNLRALVAAGHDPLGLIVDRARQRKLEVFITFRMNEIHLCNKPDIMPAPLMISRYWREHPEWRIGKLDDPPASTYLSILEPANGVGRWLSGGLNYALPEVRKLRLAQLRECCERYPIDGLDLDFLRFPMFFRAGEETANVSTMTALIRQVREITNEVGRRRGRPLLLSVRVPSTPKQALAIGLDPMTWAREGLIDIVCAGHMQRPVSPVAITEYRSALPPSVPLYGSIDLHGGVASTRTAEYRRMAREFAQDKADGILLFNFFTTREEGIEPDWTVLKELRDSAKIPPQVP